MFWQGDSNEYPQHMFLWRNKQNYHLVITKYPPYLFHCLSSYSLYRSYNTFSCYNRNSKTPTSFCSCAGWFQFDLAVQLWADFLTMCFISFRWALVPTTDPGNRRHESSVTVCHILSSVDVRQPGLLRFRYICTICNVFCYSEHIYCIWPVMAGQYRSSF